MERIKVGEYGCYIQSKGEQEAFIDDIKEGEVYFTIQIDKESAIDVKTQSEAEIISRLVRIENLLKKVNND